MSIRLLLDSLIACNNKLNAVNKRIEPLIPMDALESDGAAMEYENDAIKALYAITEKIERLQIKRTTNLTGRFGPSNPTTAERAGPPTEPKLLRLNPTPAPPFRLRIS